MSKKTNKKITISIDKEEFYRKRKKMGPEELEGYYNYTKKSAHVFKDKSKYDRLRDKKAKERDWK